MATLHAHVVSISTGDLRVDGRTATFELRIPVYEISQLAHPETELLTHFRFGDGHLTQSKCRQEDSSYVCRAEYEFPSLHPDALEVQCTLYQITVPNHVHLLTATQGANGDQEGFDQRFTEAEVRFRPPSAAQAIARDVISGALRTVESVSVLLFLVALALAARSSAEALLFCGVFLGAELCGKWLGPRLTVNLAASFLEGLLGLTVAYLALEILLLPKATWRWLVVAILGLCHGLSIAGFHAAYLAGALAVQSAIFVVLAVVAIRIPLAWKRAAAGLLLAAGLAWFCVRVWT